MNISRLFLVVVVAGWFGMAAGLAQNRPDQDPVKSAPSSHASLLPEESEAPVELPKVTVNSSRLADFPPIPKTELSGGGLAPSEPPVNLFFPGSAYAAAIPKGYATVCVELDTKGKPIDFLLVSYTEKYFGDALLRNAKDTRYSPLLFKGVAVPSRFNFGYEFHPQFTVAMNSFDALKNRQLQVQGGMPEFKYYPVTEDALDSRLEYVRQAVPNFPAGYTPTGGKPDWVMVTLYIDEQGMVRVPSVDSASSPLLVANAIKAVHYWQFKPPLVKGKPVLVYAAFALNFMTVEK
jgi:outer membrane biosynthesis protein TonB